jgi:hypothetical protein
MKIMKTKGSGSGSRGIDDVEWNVVGQKCNVSFYIFFDTLLAPKG